MYAGEFTNGGAATAKLSFLESVTSFQPPAFKSSDAGCKAGRFAVLSLISFEQEKYRTERLNSIVVIKENFFFILHIVYKSVR